MDDVSVWVANEVIVELTGLS